MSKDFDKILDDCLDRINGGQSIEECLKLYPEFAAELDPLLRAVSGLQYDVDFMPSESARFKGRQQFLQERARLNSERYKPAGPFLQRFFGQPKLWAPVAAALIVILLGFGLSSMFASDDGDEPIAIATPTDTPDGSPTATPTIAPDTSPTTSPETTPDVSPDMTPIFTPETTPDVTPSPSGPVVIASVGILEMRVTDAPADYTAVWVTVSSIEVHRAGSDEESGWETIIEDIRTFELLELRDGLEAVLGNKEIETGKYTQIRMMVENCTVTTTDGEIHEAKVPSDKVKIVGSFDIEEAEITVVTLDIDAYESVPPPKNSGQFIFTPRVKVLVGGLANQAQSGRNEPQKKGKHLQGAEGAIPIAIASSRKIGCCFR